MVEHSAPQSPVPSGVLTLMARVGFGARGAVYLLVGIFAVAAALGFGVAPRGTINILDAISRHGLQTTIAAVIGLGVICLAAYFAMTGIWACTKGRGAGRWLFAAGLGGDGLIYAAIGASTLGLVFGWHPNSEQETQMLTAQVLALPFGPLIVGIVGGLIVLCGIATTAWVLTADIDDDVALPEYRKQIIEPVGRYGLAGRGVAISLVGLYWMSAAIHHTPSKAYELAGTLQSVERISHGWLLLLTLGLAFTASAVFDFVEALYHNPTALRGHAKSRSAGRSPAKGQGHGLG